MMHPRVRNKHKGDKFDVYIGRKRSGMHWGNPFSHLKTELAHPCKDREEAIDNFGKWLRGEDFHDVEPERRAWMLDRLCELKGKTLGCFCSPQRCHGDILAEMAEKAHEKQPWDFD